MKVTKQQALKAINGATSDEVYNALDFSQLPFDEENERHPTLNEVIEALAKQESSK
tara:strand:- start:278 stop:445 length:168 start_codon:yes stop_codon:yes gene_type:complete